MHAIRATYLDDIYSACRLLSPLLLILLVLLISSNPAWGARRALKKHAEVPIQWYGSSDITYTNWIKDKWEGGGESRIAGMQFGLNLPQSVSVFVRVSAMPQPYGFQDVRAGISKGIVFSNSVRNTLSSSFSAPTSDYSRSIHQKTQASLASTLEYYRGSAAISFTGYGTKAYYSDDGAITPSASLRLKQNNRGQAKKARPPSASPLTASPLSPDGEAVNFDDIEVNYSDVVYLTRFDYLWGGALDFSYRLTNELAVNSSGSITRSTFSTDEALWACEVNLIQVTYSRNFLSIFASTGLLDSAPLLHWPAYKTYTVGTSYFLAQ